MRYAAALTPAATIAEARGLVIDGWCQGAHARDRQGLEVRAWSPDARSWSLLGALLASWHRHETQALGPEVERHLADAEALGAATVALGEAVGTASLERWNDDPVRTKSDVLAAFGRALRLLEAG